MKPIYFKGKNIKVWLNSDHGPFWVLSEHTPLEICQVKVAALLTQDQIWKLLWYIGRLVDNGLIIILTWTGTRVVCDVQNYKIEYFV